MGLKGCLWEDLVMSFESLWIVSFVGNVRWMNLWVLLLVFLLGKVLVNMFVFRLSVIE